MKITTLKSLLFGICLVLVACGSEKIDTYTEKVLEHAASNLNTTKELLVKDLDIKIDSTSLSSFLVEDSINLVTEQHDKYDAEKTKLLESANKSVSRLDEEAKTAKGVSKYATLSARDNFKRIVKQIERELQSSKEKREKSMSSLINRDKNEVIFQVFQYRVTILNPKTKMHEVNKDVTFFTPDGKTVLSNVHKDVKKYVRNKNNKK